MALTSIISSIHTNESKLFKLCSLETTQKQLLIRKVDKLIQEYGKKYPDGRYTVILVVPNVCKEKMFKKTGIVPRPNQDGAFPWAFMPDRKTDPYLIVNPYMKIFEDTKLADIFSDFYKNSKKYLKPDELIAGIFSKTIPLNGNEIFTPIHGNKNGMLIWKNTETGIHQSMVDGWARGLSFKKAVIPKCEEIIA